jgi:hypothetical protein
MLSLCVDPGIRGCGGAIFFKTTLQAADYVRNPYKTGGELREARAMARELLAWFKGLTGGRGPDLIVVEFPQIYRESHRASKDDPNKRNADPNDLLNLAAIDGALAALAGCDAVRYLPAQWKGQLKKSPVASRVESRLTPEERLRIGSLGPHLDTMEAIGIGLHHFGLFTPRRIFPGATR